jgi:hypothetical protein
VLGEEIQDIELQNSVIHAMFQVSNSGGPSLTAVRTLYSGTSTGSPARQFLADLSAWDIRGPGSRRVRCLDPASDTEFMRDLITSMAKYRPPPGSFRPAPWVRQPEMYRVHAPKEDDRGVKASRTKDGHSASKKGTSTMADAMDTAA